MDTFYGPQVRLYAVYWLFSPYKYETETKSLDFQLGPSFYCVTLTFWQGRHVGCLLILLESHFECFSGWNSPITCMYSLTIKIFLPWPWELLKLIQTVFIRNATIYLPMDPNLAIVLPIVSAKLSFFVLGQEHFAVTRAVIGSCSDQENQNLPMSWPLKVTC